MKTLKPKDRRQIWGTLTLDQIMTLRELLVRFAMVCPPADGKIDPADRKRIREVEKIIGKA
jgi:hypothetical protein